MPDVDQPVLSIRTQYEGATPATVDQEITQVLEDALSALEGLPYIQSSSSTGSSTITIDLSDGIDIDVAADEAREIVSATVRQLPSDLDDDPTVSKSDSNATAIIRLAVLGDATPDELTALAEGPIYDRLSLIDGNAEVTVDSIDQTLIDTTTRIVDVALVQLLPEDTDVAIRINGQTAVRLDITRQSEGNTLEISTTARTAVEELHADLPDGVELVISSDDGVFIEGALSEVIKSIGLATGIVILVIFTFMRAPRLFQQSQSPSHWSAPLRRSG